MGYNLPIFPFDVKYPLCEYGPVDFSHTPSVILGAVVLLAATITIFGGDYFSSALASDLTVEDLISRQDPLQDKITICHVQMVTYQKPMT